MMYGPFRRLQGDAYDWSVPFEEFPRPPPISLNLADEPEQPEIGQVRARESERGACVCEQRARVRPLCLCCGCVCVSVRRPFV